MCCTVSCVADGWEGIHQIDNLCDNCDREEIVELGEENEGRKYYNITKPKRAPAETDDESEPDWGWWLT